MTLTNIKDIQYRDDCKTCLGIGCKYCRIEECEDIPLVKLPKFFPTTCINSAIKHINKGRRKKREQKK